MVSLLRISIQYLKAIPDSKFPFDRLRALSGVERQIPDKPFFDRIYRTNRI